MRDQNDWGIVDAAGRDVTITDFQFKEAAPKIFVQIFKL